MYSASLSVCLSVCRSVYPSDSSHNCDLKKNQIVCPPFWSLLVCFRPLMYIWRLNNVSSIMNERQCFEERYVLITTHAEEIEMMHVLFESNRSSSLLPIHNPNKTFIQSRGLLSSCAFKIWTCHLSFYLFVCSLWLFGCIIFLGVWLCRWCGAPCCQSAGAHFANLGRMTGRVNPPGVNSSSGQVLELKPRRSLAIHLNR